MENKMFIIGGNFDDEGGKPSGYVSKLVLAVERKGWRCHALNGGYFSELQELLNGSLLKESAYVIWMPNIPNNYPKIRDVKSINPQIMLVVSKRNNSEYSYKELVSRALQQKANLMLVINSADRGNISTEIIDPLGNSFGKNSDISTIAELLLDRLSVLRGMSRKATTGHTVDDEFLDIVRRSGETFHQLMGVETDRYLGNSSFRCLRGFPSQRMEHIVLVSRRNVEKSTISKDDFVATWLDEEEEVHFFGDVKPSVDTPVQLRLYKYLPEVNYMIHSHCYIENAPFTQHKLPCGAIEEVEEIVKVCRTTHKYAINLWGHGSIVLARTLGDFDGIQYCARPLPEY